MKLNDIKIRNSRWPALVVGFLMVATLVAKCDTIYREIPVDSRKLSNADVRIYQDSPVWKLAKAIQDDDSVRLQELLAENASYIDYRDKVHDTPLLVYAMHRKRKSAFRLLLEFGADPNLAPAQKCNAPLADAALRLDDDTYYIQMLLDYGGKIDSPSGFYQDDGTWFALPLFQIATTYKSRRIITLLLNRGIEVNEVDGNGKSNLAVAIDSRLFDVALELLNRGAVYTSPASGRGDQVWHNLTPVEMLRWELYQLGSPEHESKMALVRWLRERGVDYDTVPIPSVTRMRIYEDYPDSVEIYLKNY